LELSETGEEFIEALHTKDNDELLEMLGRHVIEEHKECDNVKEKFADYVHESGNYHSRSQKSSEMNLWSLILRFSDFC